jgi:hypothetical protein
MGSNTKRAGAVAAKLGSATAGIASKMMGAAERKLKEVSRNQELGVKTSALSEEEARVINMAADAAHKVGAATHQLERVRDVGVGLPEDLLARSQELQRDINKWVSQRAS